MALSADREYEVQGDTEILELESGAADELYKGAVVNIGTDGYIKVAADVSAEVTIGVMKKRVTATGAHEKVAVERGKIWVPHSGAAVADVGALFHFDADDVAVDGAGSNVSGYLCVGWKTGYVLLDLRIKTL